ncbi:hypothetical protein BD779DRAFT_357086 [Infundibulicybe gibba]|nr:hypothetical protein BD779DRAFT_357086 [Infundibulicybe gibba]
MNNSTDIIQAVTPVNVVHGTHSQLIVFLVLNMGPSHFGLPLLLFITMRSKQRHPTFYNLCISFIIIGISSSLLLYAGKTTGPEPPKALCLLQASLLLGMPAISSLSAFGLVFRTFIVIRALHHGNEPRKCTLCAWVILVLPYFFFFSSAIATVLVGASDLTRVSRNRRFFYCSVESNPLSNTILLGAAAVLFVTCIIQAWTMIIAYKYWIIKYRLGLSSRLSKEFALPIRSMIFGVYIVTALGLSILSMWSPQSPIPDLAIATAAAALCFIFGSQTSSRRWASLKGRIYQRTLMPEKHTIQAVEVKGNLHRVVIIISLP